MHGRTRKIDQWQFWVQVILQREVGHLAVSVNETRISSGCYMQSKLMRKKHDENPLLFIFSADGLVITGWQIWKHILRSLCL